MSSPTFWPLADLRESLAAQFKRDSERQLEDFKQEQEAAQAPSFRPPRLFENFNPEQFLPSVAELTPWAQPKPSQAAAPVDPLPSLASLTPWNTSATPAPTGIAPARPASGTPLAMPTGAPVPQYNPSGGVEQWNDLVNEAAQTYGVPPAYIKGLMEIESNGNPQARSVAGAMSLMQVMPFHFGQGEDGMDPRTNVMRGVKIFADNYRRYGDWDRAAAAYFGAIDPETGRITDATDATGTSGSRYVALFRNAAAKYEGAPTAGVSSPPAGPPPAPPADAAPPASAGAPGDVTIRSRTSGATMQVPPRMVGEGPGQYRSQDYEVVPDGPVMQRQSLIEPADEPLPVSRRLQPAQPPEMSTATPLDAARTQGWQNPGGLDRQFSDLRELPKAPLDPNPEAELPADDYDPRAADQGPWEAGYTVGARGQAGETVPTGAPGVPDPSSSNGTAAFLSPGDGAVPPTPEPVYGPPESEAGPEAPAGLIPVWNAARTRIVEYIQAALTPPSEPTDEERQQRASVAGRSAGEQLFEPARVVAGTAPPVEAMPGEPDYAPRPFTVFGEGNIAEPMGGGPRIRERMAEIEALAADAAGQAGVPTAGLRAVHDPAWRAKNPTLAQEYDDLEQQLGLTVMGQAGDTPRSGAWDDISRQLPEPRKPEPSPRPPQDQQIREQFGRPWEEVPTSPATQAMTEESGSIARPRNQVSAEDAANLSPPVEQFPNMDGRMNATAGPSPAPRGAGVLAQVNADLGSALGSSVFGAAAGAAADQEDPTRGAQRGALIGLGAGPVASRVMRRGGAMATPGVSPGRPDPARPRVLRGNPITMTPAEEVSRLRLDKFPEPLRPHIQQAAEASGFAHDARRGVIPDDMAEQMADGVNKSVDEWITKSKAGKPLNTEETRALRNLVTGQAQKVDGLAQEIADAEAAGVVTDLLITRAHQEGERLASLVSVMEGARAEAGRTLRAWQSEARPTDPTEAAQRIFNKFGGGPEGRQRALDALKEFNQIPVDDPIARANFWARVERGGKITASDVLTAIRYNSMLSSPRTWEIGWVGSILQAPLKIVSDVMAAVSRPTSGEMGEAAKGAAMGIRAGIRPTWETIRHGITSDQALAGQLPRGLAARATSTAGRIAGTAIDLPGRMVAAPDAFFTSVFTQAEKGRQAAIAAYKQGLKGAERDRFISEFMQNTPKEAQAEVDRIVDGLMLRGDMGRFGRWASGIATKDPLIGSFVAPFMKVSYHVWTQGMDLTPVGALGTTVDVVRGAYRGGARPEGVKPLAERARMNAIGVAVTGAATWQALHGNVSGAGPDDPEKRDQLRATGWQPYSVKMGDHWVSYANWGPVAVPLSMAAAYAENQQYKKADAKPEDQMFDMAKRVTQLVTEQTFLQGIGTIMNAFEDPQRYLPTLLAQQASSFVPYGSALNTVGQSQDDYQRRPDRPGDVGVAESLSQSMQGRTPMNPLTPDRGDVPIAQGPLGQPVENQQRGAMAFQPFRISRQKDDQQAQIARTFLDAGVDIGRPPSSFTQDGVKIEMTPEQQRAYQRYMGEAIEKGFERANGASDRRRVALLKGLYEDARAHAQTQIKSEIGRSEIRGRVRAGSGGR